MDAVLMIENVVRMRFINYPHSRFAENFNQSYKTTCRFVAFYFSNTWIRHNIKSIIYLYFVKN